MFRMTHETRKRIVFSIFWLVLIGSVTWLFINIAKYTDEKLTRPLTCYDVLAAGYLDQRDEFYIVAKLDNQYPFTAYSQDPLVRYYVEEFGYVENPKLAFALWQDIGWSPTWHIRDLTTCDKLLETSAN